MTTIELMDNLAEKIRLTVENYWTAQTKKQTKETVMQRVEVYAGYPPIRTTGETTASFIYALVISCEDRLNDPWATAQVEIGFNIHDEDVNDGWRSLYNLMEHVRQALLKDRCLKAKNSLDFPLRMEIVTDQPYPQWQGKITATYSLGQPMEEDFNVGYY